MHGPFSKILGGPGPPPRIDAPEETESLSPIQPFSRWALSILGSRSSSTYDLSGSRDVIGHVTI